ncbi:MAG: hypothetical protein NZ583_01990 [Desulfobacterota bacterium]|nr:hypothetical protein [Thermodesulfobacteriota bacterium]
MRKRPHEGVDLCFYRKKNGKIEKLEEGTLIPCIFSGEVLSSIDDYLGRSVFFFSHPNIVWALGHINVENNLQKGMCFERGEVIGTLAAKRQKDITPHIHISFGILLKDLPYRLDWSVMTDTNILKLIDPMPFIALEYEMVP